MSPYPQNRERVWRLAGSIDWTDLSDESKETLASIATPLALG
jgi:hypothetical protein